MKLINSLSLFVLSEAVYNVAALPTFAEGVDMHAKVPLNAFQKRSSGHVGATADVGGHNIPVEALAGMVKKSLANLKGSLAAEAAGKVVKKRSTFNAEAQLIDVTGDHEFMLPNYTAGDVRGPCPGLNTLANHNYLPRNGVATIAEYITQTNKVWGMGEDISTILAVYGTALGGSLVSLNPKLSMGWQSTDPSAENILDNLGGLLGQPRGLSGTHNIFEVDGSNTRNDLYDPMGNNNDVNMTYFQRLFDKQKDAEIPDYTLDVMMDFAVERFYQDISWNPNFVYLPWSGWFVRNAAIVFSGRLFCNHSEEYPDGILGKEAFKSIYGVVGPDDNMTYISGGDRIPENFYRRANDYSLLEGVTDVITETTIKRPVLFSIGGNVNGVNTFAGLNMADITGGAFNAAQLLEGNNALCFAFEFVKEASPNVLSSLYATVGPVLSAITEALGDVFLSLDCPAYADLSVNGTDLFSYFQATYPGAALSGVAM